MRQTHSPCRKCEALVEVGTILDAFCEAHGIEPDASLIEYVLCAKCSKELADKWEEDDREENEKN